MLSALLGNLRCITAQIRGNLRCGDPEPSSAVGREGVETRRAAPKANLLRRRDSPDHKLHLGEGSESCSWYENPFAV